MELFVEQDSTYDKCLKKITKKHGDAVTIWRRKDAKSSRLFGLFEKDVVEVTFTVNDKIPPRPSLLSEQQPTMRPPARLGGVSNLNDEEERLKIVTRYANKNPAAADELRCRDGAAVGNGVDEFGRGADNQAEVLEGNAVVVGFAGRAAVTVAVAQVERALVVVQ